MNRKFLVQLVVVALVAGIVSFLTASPVAQANLFKDFLDKYLPSWQLFKEQPQEKSIEKIVEKVVPYESKDVHEEAVIKAVEEASPSVVSVIVSKDLPVLDRCSYDPFGDLPPELRQFFGDRFEVQGQCQTGKTERQEIGGGSGFIISADGLILTNKHVVAEEGADYTVLTNDGKKYEAKILARDPVQDLAVVKIEVGGLKPLELGDSDSIRLGQTAIAIGNALGEFRNTVSVGVISGLARKITTSGGGETETLEGLIQTDAAINPGNSGGPLLNLRGEVIGVNTAIVSGAQSIGFAITINKAKRDIESIKKSGKISIPYLGIRYIGITDEIAEKEKLSVKQGVLLRGGEDGPAVVKDSPAYKAGLRAEDIILEINGQKIDEDNSLSSLIQKYQVGDKIKLKVLRENKEIEPEVILEERKV